MQSEGEKKGKLYVVGIGPGSPDLLTYAAVSAIRASDYIVGNSVYLAQLDGLLSGKHIIPSSMGEEVARAKHCIELARTHVVSLVSGGDPGVYGMSSIVLEIQDHGQEDVDVEIIPGVTAAMAAAAKLGSPLSGDYVTISLSDLLTPYHVIQGRLELAFRMGIPVALYNPRSRGRPHNLRMALDIALEHRPEMTPAGIVKNAYRDGEEILVTKLGALRRDDSCVDMHAIVIIGGEESRTMERSHESKGIITPRGYHRKYVY